MFFSGLKRHAFALLFSGIAIGATNLASLRAQSSSDIEQRISRIQRGLLPPVIISGESPVAPSLAASQSSGSPALRSPSRRCSTSLGFLWTRRCL